MQVIPSGFYNCTYHISLHIIIINVIVVYDNCDYVMAINLMNYDFSQD